jgi:putative hydrolase of the HAD superfamily
MPLRAVTFDFHNTLANCDEWFQIEVRELVPRFIAWLGQHDSSFTSPDAEEAIALYRELRLDIMDHGEERDAYDCTIDVLERLGNSVNRETVRRGVDQVMRSALPGSMPVAGVVEAVRHLRSHGVPLAVVSSAVHHDFLEWSLEKFGILECFKHVVTSASCGFYKSRTEIYEHTLQRLDVDPADAVHVGDSYRYDVETATRAGMRTVWFAREHREGNGLDAGLMVTELTGLAPLILDHFGTGH